MLYVLYIGTCFRRMLAPIKNSFEIKYVMNTD